MPRSNVPPNVKLGPADTYTTSIIRITIDKRWTADDFAVLLRNMDDIYSLLLVLDMSMLVDETVSSWFFPIDRRIVRQLLVQFGRQPTLAVRRINYASPGATDLAGVGKVLEQLRKTVFGTVRIFQGRQKRAIETMAAEAANAKLASDQRFLERTRESDQMFLEKKRESDLAFSEREREAEAQRAREGFEVEKAIKLVELRKLQSEVDQRDLMNFREALELEKDIESSLDANKLTDNQKRQIITWLDSRNRPLQNLIHEGKLKKSELLPAGSEPEGRPGLE